MFDLTFDHTFAINFYQSLWLREGDRSKSATYPCSKNDGVIYFIIYFDFFSFYSIIFVKYVYSKKFARQCQAIIVVIECGRGLIDRSKKCRKLVYFVEREKTCEKALTLG